MTNLGIVACSSPKSVYVAQERTIEFPLDMGKVFPKNCVALDNRTNQEYWFKIDRESGIINFYKLYDGDSAFSIQCPIHFSPAETYYINEDSIYISEYTGARLLLVDSKSAIKGSWEIRGEDSINISFRPNKNQSLFVTDNSIFALAAVNEDTLFRENERYPPIYEFERNSNQKILINKRAFHYARRCQNDTMWYSEFISFAPQNDKLYILLANNNYIFSQADLGAFHIEIPRYRYDTNTGMDSAKAAERTMDMLKTLPEYGALLYDRYRDIFYRIAVNLSPLDADYNKQFSAETRLFTIQCLNSKFQIIKEIRLLSKFYDYSSIFVCKEGLLIESNFPSPNKISFQLFPFDSYLEQLSVK
jgi:hypothetical protein